MGVWIETLSEIESYIILTSHPSWVCGLKQTYQGYRHQLGKVTPFVGVWIETYFTRTAPLQSNVTPFVGVWIETTLAT